MAKVTIEEVAKAAGVSRALVSIAYRGAAGVSKQTAENIFAVGKKLGYVPNLNAARLASKQTGTIGVFLQDLHNEVFADVYDGIRDVVGDSAPLVLAVGSARPGADKTALETLIGARTDVIIAVGLTITDRELKDFSHRSKLISVTRKSALVHSVTADDYLGAELATKHLISQGHRKIGFLANPQTDGYRERLRGYQDAVGMANLEPLVEQTTYARTDAERDVVKLIEAGASAIFAHNDTTALGAMDTIVSRGLQPGKDIAVVGFDNTSHSQAPMLALTTVDPHSQELGRAAAEIALAVLAGTESVLVQRELEPALIVRSSSSAAFR